MVVIWLFILGCYKSVLLFVYIGVLQKCFVVLIEVTKVFCCSHWSYKVFCCYLKKLFIIWLLFDCLYWGVTKVLEVILITKVNIIIYELRVTKVLEVILITKVNIIIYELRVTLKYSVILCYFVWLLFCYFVLKVLFLVTLFYVILVTLFYAILFLKS